jgi:hypothetical protein
LYLLLEIAGSLVFVLSSGLAFHARYRNNYWALSAAVVLALVSSLLLFESLYNRFVGSTNQSHAKARPSIDAPLMWNAKGDDIFTKEVLYSIEQVAGANVCSIECKVGDFSLLRLPLNSPLGDTRAFLAQETNLNYCGSGGCYSSVLIFYNSKIYTIEAAAGPGISDRQAVLIAREALAHPPR